MSEPRPMSRFDRIWFWLHENEKQLKLMFTLAAGFYVVIAYGLNQRDADIKRTLDYQTRYSEGEFQKAHLELNMLLLNPANKDAIDKASIPDAKIKELVEANGYQRDVLILADLFAEVTTCVRRNLCHQQTACAIFRDRIFAHRNNYHALFESWQNMWGQNFIEDSFNRFGKWCGK